MKTSLGGHRRNVKNIYSVILLVAFSLSLPFNSLGGQAVVALHRKNAQLDAVASRSAKNVAVSYLIEYSTCVHRAFMCVCYDVSQFSNRIMHDIPDETPRPLCNILCAYVEPSMLLQGTEPSST